MKEKMPMDKEEMKEGKMDNAKEEKKETKHSSAKKSGDSKGSYHGLDAHKHI